MYTPFTSEILIPAANSYILNRGWIDKSTRRVPTYGEVTSGHKSGDNDDHVKAEKTGVDGELVDDEDFEEVVDRFESSYNHRFEEPYVTFPRLSGLLTRYV